MRLANFHYKYKREDRKHALYVFSILTPFPRWINYTFCHSISREIYYCTNTTHRWLSKIVRSSVENADEIRADIKTRTLLSRCSTDIYADICTVYGSNLMSFSTICRRVKKFSAGAESVTSVPKYCRPESVRSPKIIFF